MATLGLWDRTGDQQVRDSLLGNGRSVASTQLRQGQRAIQNAAYSQAASQRGGNPALAVRNAQHAAAIAGEENNYNQAKLRAQEQLQYQQLAQAEDQKRGQVIGGILGGAGAALGSLAGPAGTVAGGALGAAAGNLVGGNSQGAFAEGLNAAVRGATQQGAQAALGGVGSPKSSWVAGRDNGLSVTQKFAGNPQVVEQLPGRNPSSMVRLDSENIVQPGGTQAPEPSTAVAQTPMSPAEPSVPVAPAAPAQPQLPPGSGVELQVAPRMVAANQPVAEGRPLEEAVRGSVVQPSAQPVMATAPVAPTMVQPPPSAVVSNQPNGVQQVGSSFRERQAIPLYQTRDVLDAFLRDQARRSRGGV
jgi:hypothetical protein